jgi:hypothetical protein
MSLLVEEGQEPTLPQASEGEYAVRERGGQGHAEPRAEHELQEGAR